MRLALLGVLVFILATLGSYFVGRAERRKRLEAGRGRPAPAGRPAPEQSAARPAPPPGVELPSDERRRPDSLPPPSNSR